MKLWAGHWMKKVAIGVFCVAALLLVVIQLAPFGNKGDVLRHYEGVSFDSAQKDAANGQIKRFPDDKRDIFSHLISAEISFSMKVYSIAGWNNAFQTAPLNNGVRLELSEPSNMVVLVRHKKAAGLIGLPLTNKVDLNRWYDVRVSLDRSHRVEAFLDGKSVAVVTDPGIDVDVTDIAVGKGFSDERIFSGAIRDFSLTLLGNSRGIPALKNLTPLLVLLLVASALALLVTVSEVRFTEVPAASAEHQYLAALLSIISSIILYAFTAYFISAVYEPDVVSPSAQAQALLHRPFYLPEPMEKLLFFGGLVCIPVFLYVLYFTFASALNKRRELVDRHSKELWILASLVLTLAFLAVLVSHDEHLNNISYFDEYHRYFQVKSQLITGALTFLAASALFIYSWIHPIKQRVTSCINALCLIIVGLSLYIVFTENLFDHPWYPCAAYHFNAVYYSITQVAAGVPMLVDSFTNTYGLYPHFIAPALSLLDPSVLNVTCILAVLTVASFAFLFLFLSRVVLSKVLACLGFTSILWNGYLQHKPPVSFLNEVHQSYSQFYPLRTIFPFMALYLVARYTEKQSTVFRLVCFALFSVGVLWNPESGIVVFGAWLSLLCLEELANAELTTAAKKIGKHFLTGIGVFGLVATIFSGVVYIAYGRFPDLLSLFSPLLVFPKIGYAMVPMPAVHPWILYAFAGAVGMMMVLRSFANRAVTANDKHLFFACVMALGFMSYYQGRSFSEQFDCISGYLFILLVLFADRMHRATLQNTHERSAQFKVAFFSLLLPLSMSLGAILENYTKITSFYSKTNNGFQYFTGNRKGLYSSDTDPDVAFIKTHTRRGERILFLGQAQIEQYQGSYLAGSGTISAFNPGWVELFLKKDYERFVQTLRTGKYKLFVTKDYVPSEDVRKILDTCYTRKGDNGTLAYFEGCGSPYRAENGSSVIVALSAW